MSSELTNLLPAENIKAFRREYFIRLATVVVYVAIGVVIVQGVFLLPSYLYERETASSDTQELQRLSANLATTQEKQVQARLTALQEESTHLLGLDTQPTASAALQAVLNVSRPGISITGFAFTPPTTGAAGNMQLTGTSDTREDLRSFDAALGALPFVSSANLPISDYAQDANIPFTITLTGSFASSLLPP